MKQWTRIIALKKKKAGYSNNSDYFGDWFGEGQIDFSKIINPDDSGDVYMVKIWGGSGYILDVYLVKADSEEDAIDKVFEWSYENEGANKIIFDYEKIRKDCKEDYEDEYFYGNGNGKPSDKMSYDDFEDEWLQDMVSNSDYTLFALNDNFFVGKVPQEYLNKKQSSLKKKKAAIDFMTILNPTYWPLVGDKAKQFHVGDTVKLSIPSQFGPENSNGGNIPEDIVKLRDDNGTTGKIISIDKVEGIPGSDAEAMTIQLDSGERLDKFPAAWVVKASKIFKIKKAKSEKEAEYDNGYDYGDEVSGLDVKDAKDVIQHIKDDYKKGKISKSYYKGFVDGYNDAASYNFGPDQDDEFVPIK